MKLGFIGLGKMGSRMAAKLLADEHNLVVWNRSEQAIENFKFLISNFKSNSNIQISKTIKELVESLEKPRIVWIMLPAGDATQAVLDQLAEVLEKGDIVIDGGNAYFKDSDKRYKEFKEKGIKFLGIGVSGGLIAQESGYPLMVGGERSAYDSIKPILDSLARPHGGHEYFGEGGAGHFVKMVHNGIEYGYMQSIGEGFGVLEKSPYNLDLLKVSKLYQKGTLLSGFMMDRTVDALSLDQKLSDVVGYIGESTDGSAQHTVEQAKEVGVDAEIIERSLEFRRRSHTDLNIQKSFAARLISALRRAFGGHELKKRQD